MLGDQIHQQGCGIPLEEVVLVWILSRLLALPSAAKVQCVSLDQLSWRKENQLTSFIVQRSGSWIDSACCTQSTGDGVDRDQQWNQ